MQDTASAGSATFINKGGEVSGAIGGVTIVGGFSYGGADNATFVSSQAKSPAPTRVTHWFKRLVMSAAPRLFAILPTVAGAEGGWAEFDFGTTSGAKFIAKGSSVAGAQGGQVYLYGFAYVPVLVTPSLLPRAAKLAEQREVCWIFSIFLLLGIGSLLPGRVQMAAWEATLCSRTRPHRGLAVSEIRKWLA